nr:PREDICTED: WAS/WASL-interacting protein family member 1 [Anolis carolinensis]|eukprot:XP_008123430.1 PREDICTED: WAS/WASL-interacting protein family member 1 [Anolis carolinensis]
MSREPPAQLQRRGSGGEAGGRAGSWGGHKGLVARPSPHLLPGPLKNVVPLHLLSTTTRPRRRPPARPDPHQDGRPHPSATTSCRRAGRTTPRCAPPSLPEDLHPTSCEASFLDSEEENKPPETEEDELDSGNTESLLPLDQASDTQRDETLGLEETELWGDPPGRPGTWTGRRTMGASPFGLRVWLWPPLSPSFPSEPASWPQTSVEVDACPWGRGERRLSTRLPRWAWKRGNSGEQTPGALARGRTDGAGSTTGAPSSPCPLQPPLTPHRPPPLHAPPQPPLVVRPSVHPQGPGGGSAWRQKTSSSPSEALGKSPIFGFPRSDSGMTRDVCGTDSERKGGKGLLPVRWEKERERQREGERERALHGPLGPLPQPGADVLAGQPHGAPLPPSPRTSTPLPARPPSWTARRRTSCRRRRRTSWTLGTRRASSRWTRPPTRSGTRPWAWKRRNSGETLPGALARGRTDRRGRKHNGRPLLSVPRSSPPHPPPLLDVRLRTHRIADTECVRRQSGLAFSSDF